MQELPLHQLLWKGFLLRQLHGPPVMHTYREQNIVADRLARFGSGLTGSSITFFAQPPPFVMDVLAEDRMGRLRLRQHSSTLQPVMQATTDFCNITQDIAPQHHLFCTPGKPVCWNSFNTATPGFVHPPSITNLGDNDAPETSLGASNSKYQPPVRVT
uniref:RNase H type-1 domain-containing protein n=1 Tax=Nicotiana tabacum TaxID=4097 RepID=A0A1S4B690_TOBAC|nr:PREDICTED: uncharacterized protein LOC107804951 [Nicotiana tabacum]